MFNTLVQRIYSIKCKGAETTELYDFLRNSNATLVNAVARMMGNGKPCTVQFIESPPTKSDPRLDDQIKSELVSYFKEDVQIGYFNPDQKK